MIKGRIITLDADDYESVFECLTGAALCLQKVEEGWQASPKVLAGVTRHERACAAWVLQFEGRTFSDVGAIFATYLDCYAEQIEMQGELSIIDGGF